MIGILAGMGPYSTGPFLNQILRQCELQYGAQHDIDFPKILIYSVPTPFYPDRDVDHEQMLLALDSGLRELESTNVNFMAIACNTAHAYFPQLQSKIRKPLLNMIDLAVEALPFPNTKVAVISSRVTAESQIYEKQLEEKSYEVIRPLWQNEIDQLISSVRLRPERVKEEARFLIETARKQGAEVILLACLDLSSVKEYFASEIPLVDASEVLACNIVTKWLETQSEMKMRRP